jgi:hypothetical protein
MQKWEYLRFSVKGREYSVDGEKHVPFAEGEDKVSVMRKLGAEGWELAGLDSNRYEYWFKRPVE